MQFIQQGDCLVSCFCILFELLLSKCSSKVFGGGGRAAISLTKLGKNLEIQRVKTHV